MQLIPVFKVYELKQSSGSSDPTLLTVLSFSLHYSAFTQSVSRFNYISLDKIFLKQTFHNPRSVVQFAYPDLPFSY